MYNWFQNLAKEDRSKKLFHFRGSFGPDWRRTWLEYEFCSGPALKLEYQHGEAHGDGASSQLVLGLLFFTAYLTFSLPERFYFKRKCIATWDGNKEFYLIDGRLYGFYFYEWALVWHWHEKILESSSRTPWYRHFYFHFDDFFLGRVETLFDDLLSAENVKFKLGGKEFLMNRIEWRRKRGFRRHIPFSLWHREWYGVEMKIDKPPMRAGKGESGYDCGDDGAFGVYAEWKGTKPTWGNKQECIREAIEQYTAGVLKDAARYGAGSGECGVSKNDQLEFVG